MKEKKLPKLDIIISHHLTQDETIKRISNLLNEMKMQYSDKISNWYEEWEGDMGKVHFSAMGLSVSGTLMVNKSQVEICGSLPFAAMFLKGKIKTAIEDQMKTLLA
jgi:hypothetical protein